MAIIYVPRVFGGTLILSLPDGIGIGDASSEGTTPEFLFGSPQAYQAMLIQQRRQIEELNKQQQRKPR